MSASTTRINWDKPIESCFGGKAKRIARLYDSALFGDSELRNVVTYYDKSVGEELTVLCDDCGNITSTVDFFRNVAPPKRQVIGWCNIYPDGNAEACLHKTREAADTLASGNRVACVQFKLEYNEGQGL